jgi:hypothetical protein
VLLLPENRDYQRPLSDGSKYRTSQSVCLKLAPFLALSSLLFAKLIAHTHADQTSSLLLPCDLNAQLVCKPALIFLDEPTSGLDSAAAFNICQCLKDLAVRNNKTVIATIHQPSTDVCFC